MLKGALADEMTYEMRVNDNFFGNESRSAQNFFAKRLKGALTTENTVRGNREGNKL